MGPIKGEITSYSDAGNRQERWERVVTTEEPSADMIRERLFDTRLTELALQVIERNKK